MNDEVKNYLNITWKDEKTNEKISGIIERAGTIISDYAGIELAPYNLKGNDKQLFLDLCRYIYNNAYEDFVQNFMREITAMRHKYAVMQYKEETENA